MLQLLMMLSFCCCSAAATRLLLSLSCKVAFNFKSRSSKSGNHSFRSGSIITTSHYSNCRIPTDDWISELECHLILYVSLSYVAQATLDYKRMQQQRQWTNKCTNDRLNERLNEELNDDDNENNNYGSNLIIIIKLSFQFMGSKYFYTTRVERIWKKCTHIGWNKKT